MITPFDRPEVDEEQKNRMNILRGEFLSMFAVFADYLQGSRYTSLAVTALEEAAMWANKSIAFEAAKAPEKASEDESACKEGCCGSGQCSEK